MPQRSSPPSRHVASSWAGFSTPTPSTSRKPARAGIARSSITPLKTSSTTAIPAPATMLAKRVLAPPSARMAVAENDPPTGIPWKKPVVTLASPCPVKSPDGSDLLPSGFGNVWLTAAPCTNPTMASAIAGPISTGIRSPNEDRAGKMGSGSWRGMSPMSPTSSTSDQSKIAGTNDATNIASRMPMVANRVRFMAIITTMATTPVANAVNST